MPENTKVIGRLGRVEFIVMVAALIAVNAFAIDVMLPGLQQIGASLGEMDENRRQLVIPAYMIGFGVLQIIFGPLADRFGRRKPLLFGLAIYCVAAVCAFLVNDFNSLVVLRFVQGAGAAASAVIAVALVRDVFVGDQMAKTLSLVFMVLMLSPILAPGFGQMLLTLMDWRGLFFFMAVVGIAVSLWVYARLPETLDPANSRPFTFNSVVEGFGIVFSNRVSLAYIGATALLFGALMGFLNSAQQIYVSIYNTGVMFPVYFAAGAACSAAAGFVNSQLVTRFGMRRISHLMLLVFTAAATAMMVLGMLNALPLAVFFVLTAIVFVSFSMIMPNFGSLAMMPLGEVAGTAASTQGFLQMVVGASLGTIIGQLYDGTVVPMAAGFVLLALVSMACIYLGAPKSALAEASR